MWFLFLAHLIGDYALQSDRVASEKGRINRLLTWHVSVYVFCIAATLWIYGAFTAEFSFLSLSIAGLMAPLFVLHWIQDYVKCRYFAKSKQAYYADQVLHLIQLYVIRLLVT